MSTTANVLAVLRKTLLESKLSKDLSCGSRNRPPVQGWVERPIGKEVGRAYKVALSSRNGAKVVSLLSV